MNTKNQNLKISVIIPTFNNSRFLARCLRSILSQSYDLNNYEVIVLNDGSSDNTEHILKIFKEDIKVIKNLKNIGLPRSLNKGIKKAKYEYIVRLDSDDYVNRLFLEQLALFYSLNNYHAVASDYLLVTDNGKLLERCNCKLKPIACGILFKKNNLINLGLYNSKFKLHEDKEFMHRFLKKYSLGRLEMPLYRYRRHKKNITNSKINQKKYTKLLQNEINNK